MASEHCQISLEKNPEQPAAIMLMALLFSARKDYKSALELVIGVLKDFPDYYGLLVLRLKLEAKFGAWTKLTNIFLNKIWSQKSIFELKLDNQFFGSKLVQTRFLSSKFAQTFLFWKLAQKTIFDPILSQKWSKIVYHSFCANFRFKNYICQNSFLKFLGRVEEALNISKHLLNFWRKMPANYNEFFHEDETITQTQQNGFESSVKGTDSVAGTGTRQVQIFVTRKFDFWKNFRALSKCRVKMHLEQWLRFFQPLWVFLRHHMCHWVMLRLMLQVDEILNLYWFKIFIDNASVLASMDAKLSEYGGAASTISESIGIMSSSSRSWTMYTTFRIQANIWVELAELFLEMDRVADVQACVEEACNIFQNSHQAIYLKVILLLFIINCCVCIFVCLLVHIFILIAIQNQFLSSNTIL